MTRIVQIGYFDASKSPGGTTRYLLELLSGLDRTRVAPVFFAIEPYPWHSAIRKLDIEVITLKEQSSDHDFLICNPLPATPKRGILLPDKLAWILGTIREMKELEALFRLKKVDILHSDSAGTEVAPISAKRAGIPQVIATWHVESTYDLENVRGGLRHRYLERKSMLSLDYAIAVSRSTADDWANRCHLDSEYRKRIFVIPNGIDIDHTKRRLSISEARAALGFPTDSILIGSIGRLEDAKGYEYLLNSLKLTIKSHANVFLVIAGRGYLEEKLKILAKDLGIENNLKFMGFVSDVRTLLECLDIYVQPSLCEAQGIGILEAAAMNVPIIASSVGGIPETVLDGEIGFLVPPRDPRRLAEKIVELASNEPLRERMGRAARERVERNFTSAAMVKETLAVYERIFAQSFLKAKR